MSNTKAVHVRFWKSMAERFGKRWLEEYGPEPTKAWMELLDRYPPDQISAAIELLAKRQERDRAHPPTNAEFAALLALAQRSKQSDTTDHTRNWWRSVIVRNCMGHAGLLRIVPFGTANLCDLPQPIQQGAIAKCKELLDWAEDAEKAQGQRTVGMEDHVNTELWRALSALKKQHAPEGQPQ